MDLDFSTEEVIFNSPDTCSLKLNGEVHVWKFPAIKISSFFLNPSEIEFAGRFRFEGDRNRFTVGRHGLRILLSKYLSVDPTSISITLEHGQKPVISNFADQIHFNVSHSGDWVLIAFSDSEVGVDIEKSDSVFAYDDIISAHFSESEKAYALSGTNPELAFYYIWTRKEAVTKAWGTGLQENLKQVLVLGKDILYKVNIPWNIESFRLSANYPGAVSYRGEKKKIIYYDGTELMKNSLV